MLQLALKARAKAEQLDRAWRTKRRRVLYRTGGYTLKVGIRQPIPTRKTRAAPGANPHGHTRALKKNSAFDVDESRGEVAIGFVKFRSKFATPLGGRSAPGILLGGGRERLHAPARVVVRKKKPGRDAAGRFTKAQTTERLIGPRNVVASYGPRPRLLNDALRIGSDKALELCRTVPL